MTIDFLKSLLQLLLVLPLLLPLLLHVRPLQIAQVLVVVAVMQLPPPTTAFASWFISSCFVDLRNTQDEVIMNHFILLPPKVEREVDDKKVSIQVYQKSGKSTATATAIASSTTPVQVKLVQEKDDLTQEIITRRR